MRILLTGGTGQIGWELRRTLAILGEVEAPGRDDVDLGRAEDIRSCVRRFRPTLIVNAGAYTAVDKAEEEQEQAWLINATAPSVLAEEAANVGALLVHYSTDYVFDGKKTDPYLETDNTSGVNSYGKSKLAGEKAITASGADHLIFRTSWVFAGRGHNFLRTILRLAGENEELKIISDQIGAPTWCRIIAEATALVLASLQSNLGEFRAGEAAGIYHLTASGQGSWYDFACEILNQFPRNINPKTKRVVPVSTAEYGSAVARPANSLLNCNKLNETFNVKLPDWKQSLHMAMEGSG